MPFAGIIFQSLLFAGSTVYFAGNAQIHDTFYKNSNPET